MSHRRLALLICDEPIPPIRTVHGDYTQIFRQFLSSSLARINSEASFTLDAYDVANDMAYPPDSVPYDGLLISGFLFSVSTGASVYEDIEWINKLAAYVKRIVTEKPSLKVFGVCFGHQIVARALGGSCIPNNGLWEVGVTTIQLTPLGKAIFGADQLDLQQMHSDHVPIAPPNAHFLGSTDLTPNHGMVIFDPTTGPPPLGDVDSDELPHVRLTSIQVLTLQGHPEFTGPFMSMLLEARVAPVGEKVVNDGLLRTGGIPGRHYPDGLACDGVGKVGKVIWGVLGVV